jgi:hypothetical protein
MRFSIGRRGKYSGNTNWWSINAHVLECPDPMIVAFSKLRAKVPHFNFQILDLHLWCNCFCQRIICLEKLHFVTPRKTFRRLLFWRICTEVVEPTNKIDIQEMPSQNDNLVAWVSKSVQFQGIWRVGSNLKNRIPGSDIQKYQREAREDVGNFFMGSYPIRSSWKQSEIVSDSSPGVFNITWKSWFRFFIGVVHQWTKSSFW